MAPLYKNRTFKRNLDVSTLQCLSTININEESWVWHCMCVHLNFKSLISSILKGWYVAFHHYTSCRKHVKVV